MSESTGGGLAIARNQVEAVTSNLAAAERRTGRAAGSEAGLAAATRTARTARTVEPAATPVEPNSLWKFELTGLLCLSAALIYLLVSGKYLALVTPRLTWSLYVLLAFLLVWGLSLLLTRPALSLRGLISQCLVVLIPAVAIAVPHAAITGASFDAFAGNVPIQIQFVDRSGQPISVDPRSDDIPGLDTQAKTITVSNDNFGAWYDILQAQPTRFNGYRLSLTGFVHRLPHVLQPGQFTVARPLMTCCIEDITAFGLTATDQAAADQAKLGENSWIAVSGRLSTTKTAATGATTALLTITQLKPALQVTGYFYR